MLKKQTVLQWQESACSDCLTSPCCQNIPLSRVHIDTREDLIHAGYFTLFENYFLGLKDDGIWQLFYHQSCRFLDLATSKCLVHNSQRQSSICQIYDSKKCWYKKNFYQDQSFTFIKFNYQRMIYLIQHSIFDQNGTIIKIPSWDLLIQDFQNIPFQLLKNSSINNKKTMLLAFPPGRPVKKEHLNLILFRLCFPDLVLYINKKAWFFGVTSILLTDYIGQDLIQKIELSVLEGNLANILNLKKINDELISQMEKIQYSQMEHFFSLFQFDLNENIIHYPDFVHSFDNDFPPKSA